jgi:hypothetical protein
MPAETRGGDDPWRSHAATPQRSIRILKGVGDGLVSLSSAVLPGHAASEPFADPQHTLEVTNGRPPAFRA